MRYFIFCVNSWVVDVIPALPYNLKHQWSFQVVFLFVLMLSGQKCVGKPCVLGYSNFVSEIRVVYEKIWIRRNMKLTSLRDGVVIFVGLFHKRKHRRNELLDDYLFQTALSFSYCLQYFKIPAPMPDSPSALRVFTFHLSSDSKDQPQASFDCLHQYVSR